MRQKMQEAEAQVKDEQKDVKKNLKEKGYESEDADLASAEFARTRIEELKSTLTQEILQEAKQEKDLFSFKETRSKRIYNINFTKRSC